MIKYLLILVLICNIASADELTAKEKGDKYLNEFGKGYVHWADEIKYNKEGPALKAIACYLKAILEELEEIKIELLTD